MSKWNQPLPVSLLQSSKCVHPDILKTYTTDLEKREELVEKFACKFVTGKDRSIKFGLQRKQGFFKIENKKRVTEATTNKKSLSISKKRQLGLYSLPSNTISYEEALPMHHLWLEYVKPFLPAQELKSNVEQRLKLFKIEYIGAMIEVVRSKCPSLVGLKGIVIFETKFTFKIVDEMNVTKTIPKSSCVFCIIIDRVCLTVFGNYIAIRSAERVNKKHKARIIFDL